MFKSENVLREFATTRALYCVWIRASEMPGAPLVPVWIDSKMRAFEDSGEAAEWTQMADAGAAEDAPEAVRNG